MNYGDPLGDPQGILRGSYPKTGDPAFVRHIKIGGSGETTYPLYNIKRGEKCSASGVGPCVDPGPPSLEIYTTPVFTFFIQNAPARFALHSLHSTRFHILHFESAREICTALALHSRPSCRLARTNFYPADQPVK